MEKQTSGGCPGSRMLQFQADTADGDQQTTAVPSQLRQWPIQLHLVSPMAPYFENANVVLAADCVAYAIGDFHQNYLRGNSLAVCCPKLDSNQEIYEQKLITMMDQSKINTLNVMIMEVPCCGGLLQMARSAAAKAKRKVPVKCTVVGVQGNILSEDWV